MSKLVNLGSLCIDLVYQVPELAGAGETVASLGRQLFCGGKGLNQTLAAARAGARVSHFGAVGDDGDMLIAALAEAGVRLDGVLRLPGPSGHAVIQVDSAGRNSIVISGGTNRLLPMDLIDAAIRSLDEGDWLLLQNETNHVGLAIKSAVAHGARVALNLAPPDSAMHEYPLDQLDLLIVNEAEACALAGIDSTGAAFQQLIERFPMVDIVLTQGGEGLLIYSSSNRASFRLGSFSVDAVDETAAGDAFVGYLMAGLVDGASLTTAAERASAAGALAVTKAGAAPSIPLRDDVDRLLADQSRSSELAEIDSSELA